MLTMLIVCYWIQKLGLNFTSITDLLLIVSIPIHQLLQHLLVSLGLVWLLNIFTHDEGMLTFEQPQQLQQLCCGGQWSYTRV